MKKLLRLAAGAMLCLMPFISKAQTFSSWGQAIYQNHGMYDSISAPGDSLRFSFPHAHATAYGTARLVVYYEGDFHYNNADVLDENLTYIGGTGYTNPYCAPEDSSVFNISAADINMWNANDTIVFTVIPVNGPNCTTNRVRVRLMYNYCLSGAPVAYATPHISNTSVCTSDSPYTLTGTPAGGAFSGPGVTGSTFNPAMLTPGNYVITYVATDSHTCTTTGTLNIHINTRPVVNHDSIVYACNGSTAHLSAGHGAGFIWFSDAALTHALDTANVFTTPSLTQTTNYWVASQDVNNYFMLDTLTADNFATVDENNLAGDDRGGMAITKTHVYLNGDNNAVRYDLNLTPASGVQLPIRDGMFSDLRTGKIWSLWNTTTNTDPVNSPGQFDANALRGLDSNLAFTNEYINFSQTIDLGTDNQQNGIFAGFGYLGLYSGDTQRWYVVDMDNGNVSDLGFLNNPEFYGSENWSDWGVLESDCNGNFAALYRAQNDQNIHRRILPNGPVTTVANFNDLSDMASFTFDPWNNRWYWHYEGGGSVFGGNSETLGYADATDTTSACGNSTLSCPTKVVVNVPANVTFNMTTNTTCLDNSAIALNSGAPAGGTYTGIGVGTNSSGVVFLPALSGNGTFTLTYTYTDNASGCTDNATHAITVSACTGIEEHTHISGVNVFPNPNNGSFYFTVNEDISSMNIEVTDVQGRVIYKASNISVSANVQKQVNIENAEPGIYFVKMTSGGEQHVQRISIFR